MILFSLVVIARRPTCTNAEATAVAKKICRTEKFRVGLGGKDCRLSHSLSYCGPCQSLKIGECDRKRICPVFLSTTSLGTPSVADRVSFLRPGWISVNGGEMNRIQADLC